MCRICNPPIHPSTHPPIFAPPISLIIMASIQRQLHDAISSVHGLGTALSVSGTELGELAPYPCIDVSGVGDVPLPLTETRALNALHPTMASTHAHIAANEHNVTAFHASCVSVNPHFHTAVQKVAQRHCDHLGVRASKPKQEGEQQRSNSKPSVQPHSQSQSQTTLVVAKLRSLVVVWPSDTSCTVPELHAETQQGNNTNNNSNVFGCLLVQLPAAYQGGKLCMRSTSEGGKEEAHDTSARSYDSHQAASFYTDAVSHLIAPVTSGVMPFLVYDLHRTAACGHVPSPASYARLSMSIKKLVSQWAADKTSLDMYAFALCSKSRSIGNVVSDMSERDKSRVQLLKDCKNLSVFVVMMSKVVEGRSDAQIREELGDVYSDDYRDGVFEIGSDIEEVDSVEIESKWYTLEEEILPVEGAHDKSVKDDHMLGECEVFQDTRDDINFNEGNEHTFYRNVVVFCARERLPHMALSLSLETSTNFMEHGMYTHGELMTAMREHHGARKGSAICWVDMVEEALVEDRKPDVVSLLTLLNSWQTSGNATETERDGDECDDDDEAWSARVLKDEDIVKAVLQAAAVYGGDEAVVSRIAQLANNVDKRDFKRCLQLVDTLVQIPSSSSPSATLPDSPCVNVGDRVASACLQC